jgi:hypothetical protein
MRKAALLISLLGIALVQADTLALGSANAAPGAVISLPFNFTNTNQIVGMQFDLKFPVALVEVGNAAPPSGGLVAESKEIAPGQRRIVVFSPTNSLLPSDLILNILLTLLPASPSGGPTVTVRNIIFTNRQGQTFTPTLNYKVLDVWRQQYFTETEREDGNLIGDNKDPDADGVPNLLEFLQGTNPRVKNASLPTQAALAGEPIPSLTLTFRAAKNVSAAQLSVQGSRDLQSWNGDGITLTPTGVEDAATMEYQATLPIAGQPMQFLRLVGTRTPGN